MTKIQNVREQMGLVQLQFFDIRNGEYRYANGDKYYKMQRTWKKHIPSLRGRQQAILLTKHKPATSKSKASYEILGVLAILDSADELEHYSNGCWIATRFKITEQEKIIATREYSEKIIQELLESGRTNYHYEGPRQILNVLAIAAKPKEIKIGHRATTLQF